MRLGRNESLDGIVPGEITTLLSCRLQLENGQTAEKKFLGQNRRQSAAEIIVTLKERGAISFLAQNNPEDQTRVLIRVTNKPRPLSLGLRE